MTSGAAMAFKDLLLVLRSFPTPTPDATIERCVDLAASWRARLSAVACGILARGARNPLRHVLIDIAAVAAAQSNTSASDARRMLETFRQAASRRDVPGAAIFEECELANIAGTLVRHARLRDLALVPVPAEDYLSAHDLHEFVEAMVFDSGHPALLLPEASTEREGLAFDTIVVAWDGSRPAARAVADALPLLAAAKAVRILTMVNRKTAVAARTAPELAEHLAAHGIDAAVDNVTSGGRGVEAVFADHVAQHAADLIVMGAFGQPRLRQFILGGATERLLSAPPTALFLSH
jgi:nucleotide-binding universal stress UspA family protein